MKVSKQERYDLEERLLNYAAGVVRLVEKLPDSRAGNHVANQLLRSGTSPLANHGEAQGAESGADFVHKLSICYKELRESRRWIRLIKRVPLVEPPNLPDALLQETEELVRIFAASLRTAKGGKRSTLMVRAKTKFGFSRASIWSTSAGRRFRACLGFESGSKLRALQTLREVGSRSIIQRAGILLESRFETDTHFCTDPSHSTC
ncbi:hypothetical protein SBV1_710005 [Verrucomicrobia bacterium]|nr:hypothetical protein SBV1_710005 [Verrucomicrobiota bacterium]